MDEIVVKNEELKAKRIHFFNPLTILFMMIGISIMLIFANQVQYYIFLIIGFVTYIITTKENIIKPLSLIIIMNCLLYPLRALAPKNAWLGSIFLMLLIFVKLIPVFLLVKALMDYSPSELTSSFRKIGIHENISIAITIFFRYLPEFKHQIQEVKQGAKIRGLSMSPFHIKRSFEQLVVPQYRKI
ncbi:energy-coupling factor transporter transmembrane component T [Anaerosalibacter sp. Marseille-P3206]|uniref:energy-coupling factor transporter transmembrane component T n=1 Tax=Anaerosalibacter sp. Marseille-P3206 TaxID=1871005 RepID=UPI000987C5CA|nr:energy-coupling factor transporter transmembrane component T [Anaerosalibacter sp. Marseille-P3206]